MKGKRVMQLALLMLIIGCITALVLVTRPEQGMTGSGPAPSWHGITPGQTSENQLIQLMDQPWFRACAIFDEKLDWVDILGEFRRCLSGRWVYIYDNYSVQITVESSKVTAIKLDSRVFSSDPTLADFIKLYGKPDRVAWSKKSIYDRALIFASRGVLLHARGDSDENQARLSGVIYFSPMPLARALSSYRRELSEGNNPFNDPGSDIVPGPVDPWGFNQ